MLAHSNNYCNMQERSQSGQIAVSLTVAAEEPFQARLHCRAPARSCALILAPDQEAGPPGASQVQQPTHCLRVILLSLHVSGVKTGS